MNRMTDVTLPTLGGQAFSVLLDALPLAAMVCDSAGVVVATNPALLALIGGTAGRWVGSESVALPITPMNASVDGHELLSITDPGGLEQKLVRPMAAAGPQHSVVFLQPHQSTRQRRFAPACSARRAPTRHRS